MFTEPVNIYSSLISFVEGATTPAEFASWLYKNPEAEALLTKEEELPKHAESFQNLYLYLISLDLESPAKSKAEFVTVVQSQ